MKNLKVKGFTLAETLITLTILGVVAAITIPALINKYNESANRTKLKKAMAAYEKALNQMIIDNDIKGTITAVEGFKIGQCDISSSYFKTVEILKNDKCRFKTADKVGYDITDITHPIFFLSDDYKTTDLETESTNLRALAKDTDNKDVFGGVGEIKDGIVRINDKGAATGDDATILNKSYAFANKEKLKVNESVSPFDICTTNGEETCIVNNVTYKAKTITDRQCVDINFGALSGTQSCVGETGKSINVWMTDRLDPSIYGGTSVSDCTITDTDTCRESGADYWGAAINYCKNGGGHLASLGELKAGGYNGAIAAEENDPWSAYYIIDGEAFENYKYLENSIVCIEGSQ